MFAIEGRIFIDIKIDGNPLPTAANLIETIILCEGNGMLAPCCKLVLNDHSGFLTNELALTEGNSIVVTTGKSPSDVRTISRQYRLFGTKQHTTGAGPQLHIIGLYDAPDFITQSVRRSYKGNSDQVMATLADESKLNYSGPDSSQPEDEQTWLNVCKNRALFAQEVARHGYIDEHSAMGVALTSLGELRYKNLVDVIESSEPIATFIHNIMSSSGDVGEVYLVRQAKDRSSAGLMNNWQNYGSTKAVHSLTGNRQEEKSVDVETNADFLPINDQIAQTVQRARVDYSSLDCGNTHDKFFRAEYQNKKQLGLFSEKLSILTLDCTDIQIFDPVAYRQADVVVTVPNKNTDSYIVTGKTIYIKGGTTYAERIELARMSLNMKGAASLKTSLMNPTSALGAAIPDLIINTTDSAMKLVSASLSTVRRLKEIYANPAEFLMTNLRGMGPGNTGQIQAMIPSVTSLVTSIMGSMNGAYSSTYQSPWGYGVQMQAGTEEDRTITAFARLKYSLDVYVVGLASIQAQTALARASIESMGAHLMSELKDPLVRHGLILNSGGTFELYAIILSVLRNTQDVINLFSSIKTIIIETDREYPELTANLVVSGGYTNFLAGLSQSIVHYNNISLDYIRIWNVFVGLLNNIAVPGSIPEYTDVITKNTNIKYLQGLLNVIYTVPLGGTYDVLPIDQLVIFLKDEMLAKTASTLKWIPRIPMSVDDSLTPSELMALVTTITTNTKLESKRQPEMYKDQYQAVRYPYDGETYEGFVENLDLGT